MAIDTQKSEAASAQDHPPVSRSRGVFGAVSAFFITVGRFIWNLFGRTRVKSKMAPAAPVVHEEVTLTPEGAEVWQQVMDPNMPIGKPTHHQRRRLPSEDATP
jgi:hypothetical protein